MQPRLKENSKLEQTGMKDQHPNTTTDDGIPKDGTERTVHGYRAVRYESPPGSAAGYPRELNVLCGIADFSTQREQPLTKHLVVEVTPSDSKAANGMELN